MIVFNTTYDNYFIVKKDNGKIDAYEGFDLCPENVKKVIKRDGARQLECFYHEAISFGLIF